MIKQIGCCSQCGEYVWNPVDSVLSRPGVRATFILLDGSLMDLTIGNCCVADLDFSIIWQRVVAGWTAENADEYAAKQARENHIVGLVYTIPWKDVEKLDACA